MIMLKDVAFLGFILLIDYFINLIDFVTYRSMTLNLFMLFVIQVIYVQHAFVEDVTS